MLKLLGTYSIPDWAICYLVNGDKECLSEQEIDAADEFVKNLAKQNNANRIDFDTEVMDEEKYGNTYYYDIDNCPAFGYLFGATSTWSIPVYADVEDEPTTEYTISVTGYTYCRDINRNKFNMILVENMSFTDEDSAELWVETYFKHFDDMEYSIIESSDFVFEHQQ